MGQPQFEAQSQSINLVILGFKPPTSMTISEKVEQFFTNRPNSFVPAWALARLLSLTPKPSDTDQLIKLNWAMHYGQGALAAIVRVWMSANGVRGPFADFMFTGMRLLVDQTLENWMGTGALPWTWPVNEQVIDILHKGVFAFVTGWLADWWIQ
ncbi:hypothetical protein VM1G_02411 [Cytospora mali]|uniref:Uncharacterized protein n=1 Tax=Cytospora mali TaxID=578113 RepID=A0A194VSC4_CYTMA|nr:hypothetical protein VM1G_02411 [Valsa mali]